MRVEFTGDINDKSRDKEIYEEAAKRAIAAIKQGKQVVFDTTNLTKDNFTASLSQTSTGIMNYIIQTIVSSIFYAKAQKQVSDVINVKFSPAQAQMDTLAKVILMLKEHVKLINTIINIFQIKLADDPVSLRLANIFNNVTMKNKFSINTVPVASGGKRRSKKRRQRRRTTKNLRPK